MENFSIIQQQKCVEWLIRFSVLRRLFFSAQSIDLFSELTSIDDYLKLANNIFTSIKQKSIKIFIKTEHKKHL